MPSIILRSMLLPMLMQSADFNVLLVLAQVLPPSYYSTLTLLNTLINGQGTAFRSLITPVDQCYLISNYLHFKCLQNLLPFSIIAPLNVFTLSFSLLKNRSKYCKVILHIYLNTHSSQIWPIQCFWWTFTKLSINIHSRPLICFSRTSSIPLTRILEKTIPHLV